ncbi:MAG: translation elongation factor Ts [Candidatus Nealsonbacteria bacterium]|nr:translation elongation factor Ts [Candidatus Nealsonbacteria bacterium]
MSNLEQLKQLREETGVSMGECQKALAEAGGDIAKAKEILKKLGKELAQKKSERAVCQGIIDTYVHPNKKVGAMIELRCETDFVAKNPDFLKLAHELCLQVAAMDPEEMPILEQPWIKDQTKTVKNLIEDTIAKLGENIILEKFIRYEL